jgi:hypothetical protein
MCAFCIPCAAPGRLRHAVPSHSPLLVCPHGDVLSGFALNIQTFQRATFKRSSPTLPSLFFQSLTNCPRFATYSEPVSFQPITNCSVCKSFVLITIQQCRRWVGVVGLLTKNLLCLQELTSPERSLCNSFRCNTYEPLATVDSKPLTQALSSLESILTKNRGEGCPESLTEH